jgi:hypothetical protein
MKFVVVNPCGDYVTYPRSDGDILDLDCGRW